ncbi:MAG: hypothetical protein FKY71_20215 [Spiribacter salinus]|uniref:Uncharacterized protein n=1 Tax=Spiribacter salinus TaxID=1335746 RepID=A0A540V3J4_9GAMM|nr:MAG: hypothetical protein FKY71_20215 [Spiribacter salinus]
MGIVELVTSVLSAGVPLWLVAGIGGLLLYAVTREAITQKQALRAVMAVIEALDVAEGSTGSQVKKEVKRATSGPVGTVTDALKDFQGGGQIDGARIRRWDETEIGRIASAIDEEAQLLSPDRESPSTLRWIGNAVLRVAPLILTQILRK